MLYEQWCKIAAERQDALALGDLNNDQALDLVVVELTKDGIAVVLSNP